MIIDLHAHLLPGVDDGASTIEHSIELARLADAEGVKHLVLTPHHRNNQYINNKEDVLQATEELREIYKQHGIQMEIYGAQEIRINENLMEELYNGNLLSLDAEGKYYLIEFPTTSTPDYAYSILKGLCEEGITPVIAHPERNHVFAKDLNKLYEFISMGCLSQITTSSYVGLYGEKLHDISCRMIEKNLVHILASDVHHIEHRPFNIERAYNLLAKEYGNEMVEYFQENARSIFNGDPVKRWNPIKVKKSWLKFFR